MHGGLGGLSPATWGLVGSLWRRGCPVCVWPWDAGLWWGQGELPGGEVMGLDRMLLCYLLNVAMMSDFPSRASVSSSSKWDRQARGISA